MSTPRGRLPLVTKLSLRGVFLCTICAIGASVPQPYVRPPFILLLGEQTVIFMIDDQVIKPSEMSEVFEVINNDPVLRYQIGLALGRHK